MKIKLLHRLILLILLAAVPAAAADSPAGSSFLSGGTALPSGRAGTGAASSGLQYFMINPAAISGVERVTIGADYGSLNGSFIHPSVSAAIPSAYGVIGLSFSYFGISEDDTEQTGYFFAAGIAKEITSRFLFGMSLQYGYSDYIETESWGGINPGFKYIAGSSGSVTGFGIYDFTLGLSANAGYSTGDEINLNSVTAGYTFGFYRDRVYSFGFYNDFSAVNGYSDFPVKLGVEGSFYSDYTLRAGFVVPDSYMYMTYTFGAGYRFEGESFSGSIDYALLYSEENGVNHYAGLTVEVGGADREPPAVAIRPDHNYISPNYDGVQDYLVFDLDVRDSSRITGWRLQIVDASDSTVRDFRISERDIEEKITPWSFIKKLFSRKDSLAVPEKILWDGSDSAGRKLPDGKYRYHFYAWDSKDNIAPVKTGTVYIDCTPPAAEIKTASLIFSPNGDGNKDAIVIQHSIATSPDDVWIAEIRNDAGDVVFSKKWEGGSVPSRFVWDGTAAEGELLPDGVYHYSIYSRDSAGNSASAELKEIILTTKMEIADVRTETSWFSYGSGASSIRFFPELSSVKGLEKWELAVFVKEDKPLRVIGGSTPPSFIDWDCRDSGGEKLSDGTYSVKFTAWYSSGNAPASFPKKVVFDSTPPGVEISVEPELFSPDGDGENDFLTLGMSGKDNSGIKSWEIGIYNESGILFKKFTGKGDIPSHLKWDGLGDDGELVESASDYEVQFTASDPAGNISEKAKGKIAVDVLVVVTERGLKIRISNIEFAFGSATIRKRGAVILDRVHQILEKYSSYNVVVEGHTDDIGAEEYNLKLSEKRALSVRDYLVKKGTNPERLSYIGMGESLPFYPNTNDENRRRNRRVEFLLIKSSGR